MSPTLLFKQADINGNGKIEINEIKEILKKLILQA